MATELEKAQRTCSAEGCVRPASIWGRVLCRVHQIVQLAKWGSAEELQEVLDLLCEIEPLSDEERREYDQVRMLRLLASDAASRARTVARAREYGLTDEQIDAALTPPDSAAITQVTRAEDARLVATRAEDARRAARKAP